MTRVSYAVLLLKGRQNGGHLALERRPLELARLVGERGQLGVVRARVGAGRSSASRILEGQSAFVGQVPGRG